MRLRSTHVYEVRLYYYFVYYIMVMKDGGPEAATRLVSRWITAKTGFFFFCTANAWKTRARNQIQRLRRKRAGIITAAVTTRIRRAPRDSFFSIFLGASSLFFFFFCTLHKTKYVLRNPKRENLTLYECATNIFRFRIRRIGFTRRLSCVPGEQYAPYTGLSLVNGRDAALELCRRFILCSGIYALKKAREKKRVSIFA